MTSNVSDFSNHLFSAPDNAHFLFKNWGEEYVVYNNLSGETHLLQQESGELLSFIHKRPMHYQDLLSKLSSSFEVITPEDAENYLGHSLKLFHELSLIKSTPVSDSQA